MDPPPPPPLLPQKKKKGKSKAIDDDGDLDDDEKENPTEIVQVEETNPSSQNERKSTTDQQQQAKQQQQRKKSSSTMPRGRGRRSPRRQRLDKDNDFLPLLKQQQQQQEGGGEEKGRGHEIVISRKRKKTNHSDTGRPRSPSPSPSSNKTIVDDESESMNSSVWELISDIVMWKNITKSTFWFGLGSTFFVSSSFSRESNFSIISAASHLGILILGLAFFHDSLSNRQTKRLKRASFRLTEDDFLRVARLVLPLANSILAKSQEIFSGEPLMTLKVAPILLFTAKFGPLITPWRLFAIGFILSFTIPKLYSSYSKRICKIVEETKSCVWGAWTLCPNKKLVTASTAAVLWNLFSVKMRFFTAFISVVALRYQQQNIGEGISEKESREPEQQTMMLTDENLHVTAD